MLRFLVVLLLLVAVAKHITDRELLVPLLPRGAELLRSQEVLLAGLVHTKMN